MNPDEPLDDLWQRIHLLEQRNQFLRHQNDLLLEAIDTICFAFLNNSKNLDTAIQAAMALQQQARQPRMPRLNPRKKDDPKPGGCDPARSAGSGRTTESPPLIPPGVG